MRFNTCVSPDQESSTVSGPRKRTEIVPFWSHIKSTLRLSAWSSGRSPPGGDSCREQPPTLTPVTNSTRSRINGALEIILQLYDWRKPLPSFCCNELYRRGPGAQIQYKISLKALCVTGTKSCPGIAKLRKIVRIGINVSGALQQDRHYRNRDG